MTFKIKDGIKIAGSQFVDGSRNVTANTLASSVATGTAPLIITSTTVVTNLNADLLDGQHSSYYTTAGNLTGTIPSVVLGNSTNYIGTTAVTLNRASANLALTGISSVTLPGSTSGTVQIIPTATAGTTTLTLPATTGTIITSGDTGTVTSTMIADGTIVNADINASAAIAVSKLAASTISGVTLGGNLNTLTLNVSGTGLSGSTTYNGSAAATFTVTSNATNANTASAIVARDASGNFSAGTITASLSGNASTATSATTATNIAGGSAGNIPYQTAAGATAMLAAGTSGYFLKSNNTSAPSWVEMSLTDLPDAWVKKSVKAATTANITLSATQTIDGIALVAGDRVLVKDQTTGSQNGIYVVAAGAWTRTTDANTISKLAGACVNVDSGTENGGFRFDNDNKITDTLDTTSIVFFRVYDTGDSATANTANKLVLRDANGDTNVRYANTEYVNMSHAAAARTADTVFYSSTDAYIRKNTAAGFKQSLALNNVENTALSTWAGSANITTVGSIPYLKSNGSTSFSGGVLTITTPAGSLGSTTSQINTLQVYQATVNTDALMTFHISGDYAVHFGLDGTTNDLFVGGWSMGAVKNKIWHAGNDGTGSGLDADLLDGLHVHASRNNEANKVVRTDASGYIQAGWINTPSGDNGTTAITKVYASNDDYVRYYTMANFAAQVSPYISTSTAAIFQLPL